LIFWIVHVRSGSARRGYQLITEIGKQGVQDGGMRREAPCYHIMAFGDNMIAKHKIMVFADMLDHAIGQRSALINRREYDIRVDHDPHDGSFP
jgi:hypothetical protein